MEYLSIGSLTPRITDVVKNKHVHNLRQLTKAQAKKLGKTVYQAYKEFKRRELTRLIEEAKELRRIAE